jgi:hypothetical protein
MTNSFEIKQPFDRFILGQIVGIPALSCEARIQQILTAQNGTTYQVAYWFNGDRKEAWVTASEIYPFPSQKE